MTHAKTKSKAEEKPPVAAGSDYELFKAKGLTQARLDKKFQCGVCSGDGNIYCEDERGLSYTKPCECALLRRRLERFNHAGVPGVFLDASFETYHTASPCHPSQKLAKRKAQDFVKDFGKSDKGLVFIGDAGLGKTHLAVAVLKQLTLEKGVDCKFVDFFNLLADIRQGFSEDRSEMDWLTPYIRAKVLVIDELAKGRNTEWELTVLDQIISQRYNSDDRITLFTTNYGLESDNGKKPGGKPAPGADGLVDTDRSGYRNMFARESLPDKIGPRIYSRLMEMCYFVKMEGKDHRRMGVHIY